MSTNARRYRVSSFVALAAVVAALSACNTPASPSIVPFSQTDLTIGTGQAALVGDSVTVEYAGWLYDEDANEQKGTLFDTTIGQQPFTFVLGAGQVIDGWDQGIPGMRVGGRRRLVIPPNLAYGSTGFGPIPPNATLVFEVVLEGVQ